MKWLLCVLGLVLLLLGVIHLTRVFWELETLTGILRVLASR